MDIEIFGVSAVLVILGLVQLAKALGFPSRYAGLMAVLLGVLGSIGFTYQGEPCGSKLSWWDWLLVLVLLAFIPVVRRLWAGRARNPRLAMVV